MMGISWTEKRELRKVSFELLSVGRRLRDKAGEELGAPLLGSGVEMLASELENTARTKYSRG